MADLEAAADLALVKTKQLAEHVEEAHQAFAAFQEELERLTGQLDADASALGEKARALIAAAEEQAAAVSQESDEAASALLELKGSIGAAQAEGEADTNDGRAQVAALGQEVEGGRPRVAAMVEQAEEAFRGLAEQAAQVESQLEQALDEARELVGVQMVESLESMQEEIRERGDAVRATLAEECSSHLDEKYTEWEGRLAEIEAFVAKAFTDAGQHVEEVVAFCLEESTTGHTDALDEVKGLVDGTLEPAIEKLKAAVAERGAEIDATGRSVENGMDETGARLQAAIAALDAVKQLLASYTFVQI